MSSSTSTRTRRSGTSVRRPARVALTAALVGVAFVVPVAAADAAPQHGGRHGQRGPAYTAEVVGTRSAAPEGTSPYGTTAEGIARDGAVLASRAWGSPYLGQPARTRELAPVDAVAPYGVYGPRLSPSGQAYAGGPAVLVRWNGPRVEAARLDEVVETNRMGVSLAGVDDAGRVAGCSVHYRIGAPFVGSFARGVRSLTWPKDSGNCSSGGISRAGLGIVTQEAPNFRTQGLVYPRAATMTTAGVRYLKAPTGVGTSADAISPDGRRIIGRTYADGRPTGVAWLSARSKPAAVRGAGEMAPKVVTDAGRILGVENGRAVSWENGRKADLTSLARLPRGWVLTDVAGINDKGQIAVTATAADGRESVAMRLSPR